jgi:hypothetical protein
MWHPMNLNQSISLGLDTTAQLTHAEGQVMIHLSQLYQLKPSYLIAVKAHSYLHNHGDL